MPNRYIDADVQYNHYLYFKYKISVLAFKKQNLHLNIKHLVKIP